MRKKWKPIKAPFLSKLTTVSKWNLISLMYFGKYYRIHLRANHLPGQGSWSTYTPTPIRHWLSAAPVREGGVQADWAPAARESPQAKSTHRNGNGQCDGREIADTIFYSVIIVLWSCKGMAFLWKCLSWLEPRPVYQKAVCLLPVRVHTGGNRSMFLPYINVSLPLSLKVNQHMLG